MHINSRKALIALALITSWQVVLTPKPAVAQTTFPTVTVVGTPPQSQAYIQNFLDGLRPPSFGDMFENMLPDSWGGGEETAPEISLSLSTVKGCNVSQQARTDAVAREMSILASNQARNNPSAPPMYAIGTVMTLHYSDTASERFVVTSSTTSSVVITPVEGSPSGCP
jgi:hypothetical protein